MPAALADRAPADRRPATTAARRGSTRAASTRTSGSTPSSGGRRTSGRWSRPTSTRCAAAAGTSTPASRTWTSPASGRRCASRRSSPGSAGSVFSQSKDPDLGLACVEAWNDWHLDVWAGTYPGRIIPHADHVAARPRTSPPTLVRANAERGFRALSFAEMPAKLGLPSLHTGPLGSAARGVRGDRAPCVCLHTGSSSWVAAAVATTRPSSCCPTLFPVNAYVAAADWLWSGVCTRFPDLKIAMSEGGVGWVNMLADRVDYVLDHSASGHRRRPAGATSAGPSEVLAEQLLVLHDRRPEHARRRARPLRPRPRDARGRLPARRLDLARHPGARRTSGSAHLPADVVAKLTHRNAEELFRWPARLIRGGLVVDGTGAPAEVARRRRPRRPHRARRRGRARLARASTRPASWWRPGFVDLHTHYDAQLTWDPVGQPVAAARRHHRLRRQLRVHARPGGRGARRLPDADDGPGRGHAPRGARGRAAVGLDALRRLVRSPRRRRRRQRRLPRRPLGRAPGGDGRGAATSRPTPDADRRDGRARRRGLRGRGARVLHVDRAHPQRRRRRAGAVAGAHRPTSWSRWPRPCADVPGTTLECILAGCINGFTDDERDLLAAHVGRRRPAAQLERARRLDR